MTTHKPFVHLKVGMSIDGGIALASDKSNGESKYITSESSLKQVHRLRREVQAIIVGIGTVLADQPQLNVRYKLLRHGYQLPQRIILDPNGKIPLNSVTLDADHGGHTIVCVSPDCPTVKKKQLTQVAEVWELPVTHYGLSWPTLLSKLGQLGMQDVLIEGGQKVFSSALSENCVDLCHFFMAPIILGSPTMVPPFNLDSIQSLSEGKSFARWHHQRCGNDLYVKGWF
jgi:diaminohydroxyphosphoribosylaminopyrimidine deaminase/5-amino-6-(5-phosphoribosylamino)uracil reductase